MNYYEILKISEKASDTEIKNSYKELVKKYHPDLYLGDKDFAEKKIKEINEAYDILSNPEKKEEYDQYLNSISNPTITYSSNTNIQYTKKEENNTSSSSNIESQMTLSKWIIDKFDKLDKKVQLQIFIAILIILLALFLINLIKVKHYLNKSDQNVVTNTNNPYSNTTIYDIESPEDSLYDYTDNMDNSKDLDDFNDFDELDDSEDFDNFDESDSKTLDDYFYEYFKNYYNEISNKALNI